MAKTEQMKKKNYLPPRIRSYEFMAELGFTGSQVRDFPPEITERFENTNNSGDGFWGGSGINGLSNEEFERRTLEW